MAKLQVESFCQEWRWYLVVIIELFSLMRSRLRGTLKIKLVFFIFLEQFLFFPTEATWFSMLHCTVVQHENLCNSHITISMARWSPQTAGLEARLGNCPDGSCRVLNKILNILAPRAKDNLGHR